MGKLIVVLTVGMFINLVFTCRMLYSTECRRVQSVFFHGVQSVSVEECGLYGKQTVQEYIPQPVLYSVTR